MKHLGKLFFLLWNCPPRWRYVRLAGWIWWHYWRHGRTAPERLIHDQALRLGFKVAPFDEFRWEKP